MKKHTIEHVIRKLITEQSDARVHVVIKHRFGSAADQLAAGEAGAVYGFRIKAFAKKTDGRVATESEVYRAISKFAVKDANIQKYANRNYVILVSDDQRDAERNYMFTFWVFPAVYWYDITDIYNTIARRRGDTIILGGSAPLKIGDARLTTYDVIRSYLEGQDEYYLDPIKVKKFVKWANQLKQINKPIPAADMIAPDLTNLPSVVQAPKNTKISFDHTTPWYTELQNPYGYFFIGTLNMPSGTPIEGTVIDGADSLESDNTNMNNVLFKGVFKTTNEIDADTVPLKGDASGLPFTQMINGEKKAVRFTGKVDNEYPIKGKVVIDDTTYYEGTLRNFSFNNGEYYENGNITKFYENGDGYAYTSSYSGDVGAKSPIIYIKELQQDIIAMYDNNTEVFASFSALDNSFKTLKQTGATGIWDSNMQDLAYAINIVVFTKPYVDKTAETKQNAKMVIPEKSHKFIIQHKTEKL